MRGHGGDGWNPVVAPIEGTDKICTEETGAYFGLKMWRPECVQSLAMVIASEVEVRTSAGLSG